MDPAAKCSEVLPVDVPLGIGAHREDQHSHASAIRRRHEATVSSQSAGLLLRPCPCLESTALSQQSGERRSLADNHRIFMWPCITVKNVQKYVYGPRPASRGSTHS